MQTHSHVVTNNYTPCTSNSPSTRIHRFIARRFMITQIKNNDLGVISAEGNTKYSQAEYGKRMSCILQQIVGINLIAPHFKCISPYDTLSSEFEMPSFFFAEGKHQDIMLVDLSIKTVGHD